MRLKGSIFTGLALLALLAGGAFLGGRWAYTKGVQAEAQGPQAFETARSGFTWAHRLGHRRAAFEMGKLYRDGDLTGRDLSTAFSWFEKGARRGDADATCAMALAYWNGEGVAKDEPKGTQLLRQAADRGNARAMGILAHDLISSKHSHSFDLPQALQWADRGAQLGDPECMYIAGLSHLTGNRKLGREANPKLGCSWIEQAAEAGHAPAAFLAGLQNLGLRIETEARWDRREIGPGEDILFNSELWKVDDGVSMPVSDTGSYPLLNFNAVLHEPDGIKAEHFLKLASGKGIRFADRLLAQMIYAPGFDGVPRDDQKALETLQRMTDYGDAWAPTFLGVAYLTPRFGLKHDLPKAKDYFRLGANRGNVTAKNALAALDAHDREVSTPIRDDQPAGPIKIESLGIIFTPGGAPHVHGLVKNIGSELLDWVAVRVELMAGTVVLAAFDLHPYPIHPGQELSVDAQIDPSYANARVVVRNIAWR